MILSNITLPFMSRSSECLDIIRIFRHPLLVFFQLIMWLHSPPLPNTPSWRGDQLKYRDSFTFIFTLCGSMATSHDRKSQNAGQKTSRKVRGRRMSRVNCSRNWIPTYDVRDVQIHTTGRHRQQVGGLRKPLSHTSWGASTKLNTHLPWLGENPGT
jgi:hypothetical protein